MKAPTKRILSVLLAAMLMFTLVPSMAFATAGTPAPDGEEVTTQSTGAAPLAATWESDAGTATPAIDLGFDNLKYRIDSISYDATNQSGTINYTITGTMDFGYIIVDAQTFGYSSNRYHWFLRNAENDEGGAVESSAPIPFRTDNNVLQGKATDLSTWTEADIKDALNWLDGTTGVRLVIMDTARTGEREVTVKLLSNTSGYVFSYGVYDTAQKAMFTGSFTPVVGENTLVFDWSNAPQYVIDDAFKFLFEGLTGDLFAHTTGSNFILPYVGDTYIPAYTAPAPDPDALLSIIKQTTDAYTGTGTVFFEIDADLDDFEYLGPAENDAAEEAALSKLLNSDNLIDAEHFTLTTGSTIITLKESFLKQLPSGTYNLHAQFATGNTILTFSIESTDGTISDGTTLPKTADTAPIALLVIALLGTAALAASSIRKKARNTSK